VTRDQLQLVAPPPPKEGATTAPAGTPHPSATASAQLGPAGAPPPRPSSRHVLRGICRDCGKAPDVDPLTLTLKKHRYPKWNAQGRTGTCPGSGTIPTKYGWVEPLT